MKSETVPNGNRARKPELARLVSALYGLAPETIAVLEAVEGAR